MQAYHRNTNATIRYILITFPISPTPKKHLNFSSSLELLSPQQNRFTEGQGS